MTIHVSCRLFGKYAEVVGAETAAVDLPDGSSVAAALARLREILPRGESIPLKTMVAINQEHALPTRVLVDGDELALLPPLAGG